MYATAKNIGDWNAIISNVVFGSVLLDVLRQEALSSAVSEKDAHLAWLEVSA